MPKSGASSGPAARGRNREPRPDRWRDAEPPTEDERQIAVLENLLTEGRSSLEPEKLKAVKAYCRASDDNLRLVFDAALVHLAKPHAQIRLAALQLLEELFARSHLFRQLTVANYTGITNLALGINGEKLPAPEKWAKRVKMLGLILVKEWNDRFGLGYKQLEIGFNQIKTQLRLEAFPDRAMLAELEFAGSREKQDAEARRAERRKRDYAEALAEIEEAAPLMKEALSSIRSLIGILVPADPLFAEEGFNETTDVAEGGKGGAAEQNGEDVNWPQTQAPAGFTLDIDLSDINELDEIRENKDNVPLFDNLRELVKQSEKHLKRISGWLSVVQKADADDKRAQERVVRTLLDRSTTIRTYLERAKGLLASAAGENNDDDEENFEEVDPSAISAAPARPAVESVAKTPPPTTVSTGDDDVKVEGEEDEKTQPDPPVVEDAPVFVAKDARHAELLKLAPVIEYDRDLDVWDATEKLFDTTGLKRAHRFLGEQQEDHYVSQATLEEMRKRTVYIKPKDAPIVHECGAPLPKGGFCRRKDMNVCPHHGPIVPRDEYGVPLEGNDAEDEDQPWKALEDDMIANLGLPDYRQPKKRRKGNEESRLVDLKKAKDTVQNRLKKKLDEPNAKRGIRAAFAKEDEYLYRDRNAFRW